jgi:hypothetical protein
MRGVDSELGKSKCKSIGNLTAFYGAGWVKSKLFSEHML